MNVGSLRPLLASMVLVRPPGAFVFPGPNIGNLLTASAIGNREASV